MAADSQSYMSGVHAGFGLIAGVGATLPQGGCAILANIVNGDEVDGMLIEILGMVLEDVFRSKKGCRFLRRISYTHDTSISAHILSPDQCKFLFIFVHIRYG